MGDAVYFVSAVAAPALPDAAVGIRRELVVGLAVAVAVAASFALAPIAGASLGAVRLESVGRVLVAVVPVAVGLYAWRGVPFGRLGSMLILSGGVWLAVTFALADRAPVYSIGRVAAWVGWTAIVYLILAFPEGRLVGRVDRVLAGTLALVVAVLWLPTALLVDRYPTPSEWVTLLGQLSSQRVHDRRSRARGGGKRRGASARVAGCAPVRGGRCASRPTRRIGEQDSPQDADAGSGGRSDRNRR